MASKRPKPEESVTKLRQVEVLTRHGMPRQDAVRQIGMTEQTYYRWSAGGYRPPAPETIVQMDQRPIMR